MAAIAASSIYGCGDGGSESPAATAPAPSASAPALSASAADVSAPAAAAPAASAPAKPAPAPIVKAPAPPPAASAGPVPSERPVPEQQVARNRAPKIAGTPVRSVVGGTAYEFTPTASDADGDELSFRIAGRPAWASFDRSTGRLSGRPTQSDVGQTGPVSISVTDGDAIAGLASFTIEVVGTATGSASLVWAPPTENEDGSPLVDLVGYKLYWGTSEGKYTNSVTLMNPGITRYVVENLTAAEWHFVITAVNAKGIESPHSNSAIEEVL